MRYSRQQPSNIFAAGGRLFDKTDRQTGIASELKECWEERLAEPFARDHQW